MNRAVPPSETATWAGEAVDVDQEQLTQILARYTPWIAHVREQQNLKANGHFVVVTRIEDAHVQILDPWDPGTAYHMKTECFLAHWTLELVWPKRIP